MTEPTAPEHPRPDVPAPHDGAASATLDWVVGFVDAHVLPVEGDRDLAVMAAAWALGFAGATREQVWWVLRDDRLRAAFTSLCHALGRVRGGDVPAWLRDVPGLAPGDRAALATTAASLRVDASGVRVGADAPALLAIVRGHHRAVVAPDGTYAVVPPAVLDELCDLARSVTAADVERLMERARGPFGQRLREAAAVAREERIAFLARRARDAA
jgi:hypothetical protein